MTKKVACLKCKHIRCTEYQCYCNHPKVSKEYFDPVYGSRKDYKACSAARETVCKDGKYYEPSLLARLTGKTD